MRPVVLACLVAAMPTACSDSSPAADARIPDASTPDGDLLDCDSVIRWCEDGQIFEGFQSYNDCGQFPVTCTRAEAPLGGIHAVYTCPSGCAIFDGGTACLFFDWFGQEVHPEDFCAP